MTEYLDLATSLYTNSLTLFVGTGFSKYLTNGIAPNWLELLVEATKAIDHGGILFNQLFNTDSSGEVKEPKYDLTICAQILEGEYLRNSRDLKKTIKDIIRQKINSKTIDKGKLARIQSFFSKHPNINIITTNYDTLFSEFVFPFTSRIIIEQNTIPRINSGQNIYHIHGCISKPESIVLTINDYYNFQNSNNYYSRKFFTLLQETTVAILGYSLGDFNLNSILNEVMNSKMESFRKADLYYISRDKVAEVIEKFYSLTYGIKVIELTSIQLFFDEIEKQFDKAKELIENVEDLNNVIKGTHYYPDEFLKLEVSLSTILVQAASLGIESSNKEFLLLLMDILRKKQELTHENGAWSQYVHLAHWLIEIASIIKIKGTVYEEAFCTVVKYSLDYCSKTQRIGYSWDAWGVWHRRCHEMKIGNQVMVKKLIDDNRWSEYLGITEIFS